MMAVAFLFCSLSLKAQYAVIFSENMGNPATTTGIDTNVFQNANLTFSYVDADVRTTSPSATTASVVYYPDASGGGNIYLKSSSDSAEFSFGPINTITSGNIGLSFGMRKAANKTTMDSLEVLYSVDNINWTPLTMTKWERWKNGIADTTYASGTTAQEMPTSAATGWYMITYGAEVNTIPSTSTLYIKIRKNCTTSQEIRIDDVVLTGEPIPYVTINSPVAGTYGICDQFSLDVKVGNFNLTTVLPFPNEQDGLLKIESSMLASFGMDSVIFVDKSMYSLISMVPAQTLPVGNYDFIVTLVDNDSLPILPLATDTLSFTVQATATDAPVFTPEAGAIHTPQSIEISAAENAVIYYTIDGTEPDSVNGILYTEPIEFTDSMTIKAIAYEECFFESEVVEATFTKDVTGIADVNAASVKVSPNPATSVLNVSANGFKTVEVVNFLGQVVYSNNVNGNTVQINVSDLNNGVYFVRLSNENSIVTKKFIKK